MFKMIYVWFSVLAVIKSTHSQCIGRGLFDLDYTGPYSNIAYDGYRSNPLSYGLNSFGLSSAFNSPYAPMSLFGNFPFSKITSTGNPSMSVLSENIVEGVVSVAGRLPFITTIGVDGTFPTTGTAVVNYNCGGVFGIFEELPGPVLNNLAVVTPTMAPALAPTLPAASFGYGPYDYSYGYGPLTSDAYLGDYAYNPAYYGLGPQNYGMAYGPIANYDTNFYGYGIY